MRRPIALLAVSLIQTSAHADVISVFDFQSAWTGAKETNFAVFAGNSPSTDTDLNSTTSLLSNNGFTAGAYASYSIKDSVISGTSVIFSTSNTPDTGMNLGGANQTTATKYISFTVTPQTGFETTYQSLTLFSDINAISDQYNIELRAVIDGGAETTMGAVHSHTPTANNEPVHLVTFEFDDFTSAGVVEWRIYGYNIGGAMRLDDITLNGLTTASSAAPPMVINSVNFNSGSFEVHAAALIPEKLYQLTRSDDLMGGFTTIVDGPRSPAGTTDTFTDPSPPPVKAFYRLERLPE